MNPAEVRKLAQAGVEAGLREVAIAVKELAQHNAPVGDPALDPDPGVSLKDSARIDVDRGGRSVQVVFDTPYAAYQHENQHAQHPRGGGPKYLEKAVLTTIPKIDGAVAAAVRARIGGRR